MKVRKGKLTLITALSITLVLCLNVMCYATTITNPAIDPVTTEDSITVVDATYDPTIGDPTSYDVYSPSSITPLPGGGVSVNFIINGMTNSYLVPPNNFNPKKATNEQLEEYGLPTRPSDPNALKDWEKQIKNYKKAVKPSKAYVKKNASNTITNTTNSIWSGTVITGGSFQVVTGSFTQPTISGANSTTQESTWVGIGGYGINRLIQCGTASNAGNYTAWYEVVSSILPNPQQADFSYAVSPGNNIGATVKYNPTDDTATFIVSVNGNFTPVKVYYISSNGCYDGSTAEWIAERPKPNITTNLANFNQVNFTGCQASTNININSAFMSNYNQIRLTMVNNGTTLAAPIDTSYCPTCFSIKWYHQ